MIFSRKKFQKKLVQSTSEALDVDRLGDFNGKVLESKMSNLNAIFRGTDEDHLFVRVGMMGEERCFFHALLATGHPLLPVQFGGQADSEGAHWWPYGGEKNHYFALNAEERRAMADEVRAFFLGYVKAVLRSSSKYHSPNAVISAAKQNLSDVLTDLRGLSTDHGWLTAYLDLCPNLDGITFLFKDLSLNDSAVGHEAMAMTRGVLGIIIVLAIMQPQNKRASGAQMDCIDGIDCAASQIADDAEVIVLVHVKHCHFEPVFQVSAPEDGQARVASKTHTGNSTLMTRIKRWCLDNLADVVGQPQAPLYAICLQADSDTLPLLRRVAAAKRLRGVEELARALVDDRRFQSALPAVLVEGYRQEDIQVFLNAVCEAVLSEIKRIKT